MKRERMLSSTYKKILVLYTHKGGPRGGAFRSESNPLILHNRDLLDLCMRYAYLLFLRQPQSVPGTAPQESDMW